VSNEKAFKPMGVKPLTDAETRNALGNHASVLVNILGYINHRQQRAWRQRALNCILGIGVLYSVHRPLVDSSLVQLWGYLSHILGLGK
jgi:hypothetical protein